MNRVLIQIIVLLSFSACRTGSTSGLIEISREENHMGTVFQVAAIDHDRELAKRAVDAAYAEVKRIESLISSWDKNSETAEINRQAEVAVFNTKPILQGDLLENVEVQAGSDVAIVSTSKTARNARAVSSQGAHGSLSLIGCGS